ncbi:SVEP1-like protein, partial [Mya arenaria]
MVVSGLGHDCKQAPDKCNDKWAECSSGTSVCKCKSGFTNVGGVCKSGLGGACDDDEDCSTLTNSECKDLMCACVDGYGGDICLLKCDTPIPTVEYGRTTGNIDEVPVVGASVTFVCYDNYEMQGVTTIKCGGDGKWSPQPECVPRLNEPCTNKCVDKYSECKGTCKCANGYHSIGDECFAECGSQPSIRNAKDWTDAATTSGTVLTVICQMNFFRVGPDTVTCEASEEWTTAPECVPGLGQVCSLTDKCYDPLAVCNGICICRSGFTNVNGMCLGDLGTDCDSDSKCADPNSWCNRNMLVCDCKDGYLHTSQTKTGGSCKGDDGGDCDSDADCYYTNSVCNADKCACNEGFTFSSILSRCQEDCPTLDDIANGSVTLSGYAFESTATYSCNPGFASSQTLTRTCRADSQWSGFAPKCTRDCGTPPNIMFMQAVDFDSTLLGSDATYGCRPGYILVGSATTTCLASGNGKECRANCYDEHASCTGNPTTCQCIENYVLDPADNMCRADFDGPCLVDEECFHQHTVCTDAVCQCDSTQYVRRADKCVIECGVLENPAHGSVETTGNEPGAVATFSCEPGYTLEGQTQLGCGSDRIWNGDFPTCSKNCPILLAPMNGIVTQPDPAYNALEATFSCLPNYWLSGENVLVCLVSGEWNSDSPTCQPNCPMLTPPANSLVIHSGLTPGSTATYVCNPLYTLAGSSTRECSETSMWSGLEPSCLGVLPLIRVVLDTNCGMVVKIENACRIQHGPDQSPHVLQEIDVPDNMRVSYSEDGSVVTFSCRNGYRLVGPESSTCSDNSWDGQQPLCLKECTLRNIPHAMVSGPYPPYVGQSITVDCSDRYSLVGPSQLVCTSDGTFDKDDSISCVR